MSVKKNSTDITNSKISVLYVEDNPADADLLLNHFDEYANEFDITIANDGQTAINLFSEKQFDLILLDNHLPDMEGIDVLKTLVTLRIETPVVMLTGTGNPELVKKSLWLYAINYISKKENYLNLLPAVLHNSIEKYRDNKQRGIPLIDFHRILLIADDQFEADNIVRYFNENAPHFLITKVNSIKEMQDSLTDTDSFDLVLQDISQYEKSETIFIQKLKKSFEPMLPFIVLSGLDDDTLAIEAISQGAKDFIVKEDGYLDQLIYKIEKSIEFNNIFTLSEKLKTELAMRRKAEEELKQSIDEKELILAEVNHRIKNNFNIVSGLLELQSAQIHTPAQAAKAFIESRDRITSMAIVHEELYLTKNYTQVDMQHYVDNLTQHLRDAYDPSKKITHAISIEKISLPVSQAVACGIIITELLTNAYKYAFKTEGFKKININLETFNTDKIRLTVSDNGEGFSKRKDENQPKKLGMALVEMLTKQLNGVTNVSSNDGTLVTIQFPDSNQS